LDLLVGVEGVDVPVDVGTGVDVPEVAAEPVDCRGSSMATVISVAVVEASLGAVPPRSGESMCRVVAGCRPKSATVLEGDRWRPECSNRTSEGRVVDADRKSRTSEMVFDGLTFSGMAVVWVDLLALPDAPSLIEKNGLLTFTTADGHEDLDVVGRKRFAGSRGSHRR
jgi:hypothetical protein